MSSFRGRADRTKERPVARKSLGRFRFFPSGSTVKMVVTHFVNEDGTKAMKSYLPQTRVAPFGTFESEAVATSELGPQCRTKEDSRESFDFCHLWWNYRPTRSPERRRHVRRSACGRSTCGRVRWSRECRGGFDLVDSSLYLFSEFLNGWVNLSGHRFSLILGRDYAHILCTQKS